VSHIIDLLQIRSIIIILGDDANFLKYSGSSALLKSLDPVKTVENVENVKAAPNVKPLKVIEDEQYVGSIKVAKIRHSESSSATAISYRRQTTKETVNQMRNNSRQQNQTADYSRLRPFDKLRSTARQGNQSRRTSEPLNPSGTLADIEGYTR
jgi:hypothetical protein